MTADYLDSQNRGLTLGAEIARGGEGVVFEVVSRQEIVAKIYHKEVTTDKIQKLQQMVQMNSLVLGRVAAWPLDLLYRSGRPIGLLMPRVTGLHKDIHKLYSPKSRRSEFTRSDWRFIVHTMANVARAFAVIHDTGCVIGDVNHSGILVSQDATVKLIDCDSFQVPAGNRYFLCEVGVDNYTPPELQGRSFAGVVRTQNHDAFGLAVMAFLMLFMGRHPFAGRFLGSGDMPIATAIKEGRFAYGAQRNALLMEKPPGTPNLEIVGGEIADLLEQAFSPNSVRVGRPSAHTWAQALTKLQSQLKQCFTMPWHWHFAAFSNCPWCSMETALGVALFPAIRAADATGIFSIDRFWQSVSVVPHPGPVPTFVLPVPSASTKVKEIKQDLTRRTIIASTLGLALVAFIVAVSHGTAIAPALFVGGIFFWLVRSMLGKPKGVREIQSAFTKAEEDWNNAKAIWNERASPHAFEVKKSDLDQLRRQWDSLSILREKRQRELQARHALLQMETFLDQFELYKAKIDKIGPGRKQILESYGIESASDLSWEALARVPGFGPVFQRKLMNWKTTLEKQFVFNPSKPIDPSHLLRIDQENQKARADLQNKLEKTLCELKRASQQIIYFRQQQQPVLVGIGAKFGQAKTDLEAFPRSYRS
jgi:DNA-binding helix-hairpin-helix protein with protein kinase domain